MYQKKKKKKKEEEEKKRKEARGGSWPTSLVITFMEIIKERVQLLIEFHIYL
jgi:hypothetical protein